MNKHNQILKSAEFLFLKHGFSGVSMIQVAEHAGVSKQTIYAHFNSKDELFTAVLTGKCPVQHLPEALFATDDHRETMIRIGHFAADILLSDEGVRLFRLCMSTAEDRPDLSQRFFDNGPGLLIQHLAEYIKQLNDEGLVSVDQPRLAAAQFLMAIRGEAGLRLDLNIPPDPGALPTDEIIERTVDFFLNAYTVKNSH